MDELDVLKQHWNKDNNFPKINREEIREMLHKSSSSIVKWIFAISCLEFSAGILLNYLSRKYWREGPNALWEDVVYVFYYVVLLIFIILFFKKYKNIKAEKNTKKLTEDIIATRKLVQQYIYVNFFVITVEFIQGMWDGWHNIADTTVRDGAPTWVEYSLFIGIMLVLAAILFSLIALFYYLLYIRLTKKLHKNYKELIQLDH
ncbi:hypothetical protein FAZ19_01630 [Sphingobacterium alkalisoli]|uniref:Uncharacterized protein n=1 Tax=Sphingobacterium alkalisoli TaxID=1874115 RepID=A0A4U0H8D1_9SPHI|nr:hypothetical protein [Sphingobacterium alkalisoli]TJY67986.1 hypothetical protein FAZ19_01630 [Sphingobacterium alkalisoli]GGH09871.1 hypothetical protein GCM10011418_08050 [Sphingobacterium alkalisoli]